MKEEWEREEGRGKRIFRESKKTPRSPVKERDDEIRRVMQEWKEKNEKDVGELRGLKKVRDEINKFREEVRKELKKQCMNMSKEIQKLTRKMKEVRDKEMRDRKIR